MRSQKSSDFLTESRDLDRRAVLRVAAWSVPVIALATASPAQAVSLATMRIELVTGGLAGAGVDLRLRDGKFSLVNANNTSPTNNQPVLMAFRGVDEVTGALVPQLTWSVQGDDLKDGQTHFMLGFFVPAYPGPFTEGVNSTKQTAQGVSATGLFPVRVNTSTWSNDACPVGLRGAFVPPSGTFTVNASAPGYAATARAFTYLVYNFSAITCPRVP